MHAAPAAQKKMIIPQENQPVNANISKEKGARITGSVV